MSPIACAWFPREKRAAWRPVLGLALVALLSVVGCKTTSPLAASVPQRAASSSLQLDGARWDEAKQLAAWALRRWQQAGDPRAIEAAMRAQREEGQSVEGAWMTVLADAGIWVYSQYGTMSLLQGFLTDGVPVIVQVVYPDQRERHMAIVAEIDNDRSTVVLVRPDGAEVQLDRLVFGAAWQRTRRWMATVCPPARARWSLRALELLDLVRFHDRRLEVEEADTVAARAVEQYPDNPDVLVSLAVRARQLGRVTAAERWLRHALRVDDRHARAANNLAFLLAEQGRSLDEAASLARRAVLLEPTNPYTLDTQGFVFMQQKNWPEACRVLDQAWQRARTLSPAARVEIGLHLAEAHRQNEEPRFARDVLHILLKDNPGLLLSPALQQLTVDPPASAQ